MQDRKKKKKSKIRPWRPPAASRRPKAAEVLSSARPHCCRPDLSSYGEHVGLDSSWLAGLLDRWTASRRAAIRLLDGLLELLERRLADHVHGPATARAARFWFAVPKGESHAGRTSNLSRLEAQEQRELSVTGELVSAAASPLNGWLTQGFAGAQAVFPSLASNLARTAAGTLSSHPPIASSPPKLNTQPEASPVNMSTPVRNALLQRLSEGL